MTTDGATKLLSFTDVPPQTTVHGWWNNAKADVYRLNAWPKVTAGTSGSAEIVKTSSVIQNGNPPERELHFSVKNSGSTTIDIDVWAHWWRWPFRATLEAIRAEFGVPAVGGATVTNEGIRLLDVAGIRKDGSPVVVEPGDHWHLGSDTKAMTATLVAVLAQKGVVDWDTTLAQAFPEWSQTMETMFKDATFERLMAHRSGIFNVTVNEQTALADVSKTISDRRREFANLITHRQHGSNDVVFNAPGFAFSYQNANFILVGAMLERITGKSWEDLMTAELFQPLGMATAGFGAPGSANDVKQPYGHSDASGTRVASKGDNTPALGPAGTVHASLHDWGTFIRLHLDGSAGSLTLSSTTLAKLHTEFPSNAVYPNRYGWGWILFDAPGGIGLGHDGSNNRWYCTCQVLPSQGVGFLAVSNIGGGTNGNGNLACGKVIEKLRQEYFLT